MSPREARPGEWCCAEPSEADDEASTRRARAIIEEEILRRMQALDAGTTISVDVMAERIGRRIRHG